MKKLKYIMLFMIISLSAGSCLKEDFVLDPSLNSLTMYMLDVNGKDSLVTEISKGITVKFMIETEAEVCSVWPGGVRSIMKKIGTTIDSLDMFHHPVLRNSDCYSDYGLVGARGYKGTQTAGGWYVSYKYQQSGSFDMTIVLTNHGYQNPDYRQVVIPYGKITVK